MSLLENTEAELFTRYSHVFFIIAGYLQEYSIKDGHLQKSIEIQDVYLLSKTGGKSGDFVRP